MDPEQIDWETSRKATKREPIGKRRVDIKLLCAQCRLNKVIFYRQKRDDTQCPLCNGKVKDRDHLLTCPHLEATKLHLKLMTDLKKKLEKLQTNAKLSKTILGSLRRLRKRLLVRNISVFNQEYFGEGVTLTGIIEDQEKIGWNNFILGR